jgi:F-type H+-transporting ATPase subunit alpha
MDDVDLKKVAAFEKSLRDFLKSKYAALVDRIDAAKNLSADDEKELHAAVQDFKKTGSY